MNLESLRMFCLVVDDGSISKTARLNFVSQPAITRLIRQLEKLYGAKLFERTAGKLTFQRLAKFSTLMLKK